MLLEIPPGARRPTNLSVRADLRGAARQLGINLSALLEQALTEELARLKRAQWRIENARAIEAYNAKVRLHGTFSAGRRAL